MREATTSRTSVPLRSLALAVLLLKQILRPASATDDLVVFSKNDSKIVARQTDPGPLSVTLYTGEYQTGASETFGVGRFDLFGTSIGSGSVSSVRVSRKTWLHICAFPKDNPDDCLAYGRGLHNLPPRMNDRSQSIFVSKVRPRRHGTFGNLSPAPDVPIFAAVGPLGEVMFFRLGVSNNMNVYHPGNQSFTKHGTPPHNVFCAGLSQEATTGNIVAAGGGQNGGVDKSAIWDWDTYSYRVLDNLPFPSYYGTSVAMPDGTSILFLGSSIADSNIKNQSIYPQVHRAGTTGWRLETNLDLTSIIREDLFNGNWFPFLHVISDGSIFHSGPIPNMHTIDIGTNTVVPRGRPGGWDQYRFFGVGIMYDALGKILVCGGTTGPSVGGVAISSAVQVDATNPKYPTSKYILNMHKKRALHHAVILPDGKVFVSGGAGIGQFFSARASEFSSEIWNPLTGRWKLMAESSERRVYHSSSLLMADGTVWCGGGQARDLGADGNQQNIDFFVPPELYTRAGILAARPTILSGPSTITINGNSVVLRVNSPGGLAIREMTAVRLGTSNHQMNMDTRFISFTKNNLHLDLGGGRHRLTAHRNKNVMVPGYWMVFAINSKGVYSEAKIMKVQE